MRWLVTAHDAGGAEVVSSWVNHHPEHEYRYLLGEKAEKIFAKKLHADSVQTTETRVTQHALDGIDFVLAGSSWSSDLERQVIRGARKRGILSAVYLDHWGNYRERFGYPAPGWEANLPDCLWCGDEEAKRIAESLDIGIPVKLVPNLYLEDLAAEYASLMRKHASVLYDYLYVTEPIRDHMALDTGDPMHLGYDEFTALGYAITIIGASRGPKLMRMLLRTHPAERTEKYNEVVRSAADSIAVDVSSGATLLEDLARCERVIGCESMAMAIARSLGKRVFTSIPPGGRPCVLPFKDILPIAQMGRPQA
jgi:hypothetical protein